MPTSNNSLSPENRALARELWQALYNAPDAEHLSAARHGFNTAPVEVRTAILRAAIPNWRNTVPVEADNNPFD
ncbi:MAG: hypothetical protein EOP04_16805 [Proteobacteria bacterium]|nr:MAG: hypothetical protein EOP04_16805 [Pseudomonadota bacterium]